MFTGKKFRNNEEIIAKMEVYFKLNMSLATNMAPER